MGDDEEVFQDILAWFVCLTDPLIPDGERSRRHQVAQHGSWPTVTRRPTSDCRNDCGSFGTALAEERGLWTLTPGWSRAHFVRRPRQPENPLGARGRQPDGPQKGILFAASQSRELAAGLRARPRHQDRQKTIITPEIRWIINGTVSRGLEAA